MTIISSVKEFSARYPDYHAVIDSHQTLTYRELDSYSSNWARFLAESGIQPGAKVMICLRNSSVFVAILLALEKLNTMIIPLNYHTPSQEVEQLADEYGISLLITEEFFRNRFSDVSMDVLYKEEVRLEKTAGAGSLDQEDEGSLESGEMLFFTSGSTGKPKGIVVKKSNIAPAILPDMAKERQSRHFIVRPIFFRSHLTLAYGTLLQCDTLILSEDDSPGEIYRLITEHEVTQITSGPTDLQQLVDYMEENSLNIPSSLAEIMSTGRALSAELRRKLPALAPHATVIDFYGTSEAGPITSIDHCEWNEKAGSSGLPEYFIQLRIMDEDGRELEAGEIGEVSIKSGQIMNEYYNDPLLTDQTFHGEFLRSGDLGYLDEDGYLYLVGRSKEVINKGGYNFYCSEIEDAFLQIEEVKQAAVIPVADKKWGQVPAAFLKLQGANHPEEVCETIRQALLTRLAEYKCPEYFTIVADIPVNLGGKVDKKSLERLLSQEISVG
ncbi:class I adenylate-forming enzyme family protein [Mesobacillus foraminis]|uniref:Acyl-CoA synthetase (AMP-forming)/AMP-acid ligase II n=2 Tax=Mesobacillus foraminis TaxID=279826 RepID=A0A4R2B5H3_9BACI|nr:class I adenylate-forming enzyme family protein [Mesobacillus foraminis]TCN20554.1 acyl-CoA synthetase (AMP-forming)/AMP-acid ligase II [Mesobacillus foraminis]